MELKPHIVFVYNADSGIFNTVSDIAHKIFSPETYSCNLCAITYGNFGMRAEWREYLESLEADLEFLHRDELSGKYGITDITLPTVLIKNADTFEVWITADAIMRCNSVNDLKLLISERLDSQIRKN
ncbi:MAG: hypothetical protein WCP20_12010 [Desulfuromonadales bacterium]